MVGKGGGGNGDRGIKGLDILQLGSQHCSVNGTECVWMCREAQLPSLA